MCASITGEKTKQQALKEAGLKPATAALSPKGVRQADRAQYRGGDSAEGAIFSAVMGPRGKGGRGRLRKGRRATGATRRPLLKRAPRAIPQPGEGSVAIDRRGGEGPRGRNSPSVRLTPRTLALTASC
jgi:hypothetical protein